MKIMVVDDEKDIKSLFSQKFRNELRTGTIQFHFCHSAEEALQYFQETESADIVLILSDINMPGMNGLELLRILKEKFSTLKVFMITAYDDEIKYKKALEYGADEYLTKPIDFIKLKEEIFKTVNIIKLL